MDTTWEGRRKLELSRTFQSEISSRVRAAIGVQRLLTSWRVIPRRASLISMCWKALHSRAVPQMIVEKAEDVSKETQGIYATTCDVSSIESINELIEFVKKSIGVVHYWPLEQQSSTVDSNKLACGCRMIYAVFPVSEVMFQLSVFYCAWGSWQLQAAYWQQIAPNPGILLPRLSMRQSFVLIRNGMSLHIHVYRQTYWHI